MIELLKKTTYAEKRLLHEQLSYGMLFKHEHDYRYFKRNMNDNWLQFSACKELMVNNLSKELEQKRRKTSTMSSAKESLFFPLMQGAAGLVFVVCVFGIACELRRKK